MDLLVLALLVTLAALVGAWLAVRRTLVRQVAGVTEWLRRAGAGAPPPAAALPRRGPLAPLAREAAALARLVAERGESAEQEARLRRLGDASWTEEKLRDLARAALGGRALVVVANRQPYRHVRRGGTIQVEVPASGLVTAVEPILRACGGTWIAHGDGSADRATSDERGRLAVPPAAPQYALRRVWLGAEEHRGHYAGLSNEGLWPLCHIAHVRPSFRPADWAAYRAVNERFAAAALDEIEGREAPVVFVQDYHFALLPRLIKARRPDARVGLFWHIPWPNPEAFGVCPWQAELLDGMLGADLVGFHTRFHCRNFLDTVDRSLEAHVDRELSAVTRGGTNSRVSAFPISVAPAPRWEPAPGEAAAQRAKVLRELGVDAEFLAVGVDRADYTKGIVERLRGVERLLELYPRYRGRLTLLQVAAPSRGEIAGYRALAHEIDAEARRINARFAGRGCPPVTLRARLYGREDVLRFYRAADACVVTALHDGMNLVAKEFVSAREDLGGALVLSRFTGAAQELTDALLVNPYDVDAVSEAIRSALEMRADERARRMQRLRQVVQERNVYKWAADLLGELAALPSAQEASHA